MQDSKLNTPSELLLHRALCKTDGLPLLSRFYIRGWFLTCCLQMLRNRHRRRRRLPKWGCGIPRETPRGLPDSLQPPFPHPENWATGSSCCLRATLQGTVGTDSRLREGFELSGSIKVKVLRTEISKLQGKSAWSLKTLPLKSQCWYDSQQKEFFPPN